MVSEGFYTANQLRQLKQRAVPVGDLRAPQQLFLSNLE